MAIMYGPNRTKIQNFIESKGGEEVTLRQLREELPDISQSNLSETLRVMVNEGVVERRYRGVFVAPQSDGLTEGKEATK